MIIDVKYNEKKEELCKIARPMNYPTLKSFTSTFSLLKVQANERAT